jgi:hypothetical protein
MNNDCCDKACWHISTTGGDEAARRSRGRSRPPRAPREASLSDPSFGDQTRRRYRQSAPTAAEVVRARACGLDGRCTHIPQLGFGVFQIEPEKAAAAWSVPPSDGYRTRWR